MSSVEISIDAGTLILIRQILRRAGRPDITADEVAEEVITAINELQQKGEDKDETD